MKFTRSTLHAGVKYFICLQTTEPHCTALRSCSNGFVVDTQPPSPGSVYIGNPGDTGVQYAVDQFLHVSWSACSDGAAGEETGYVYGIAGYNVAIGEKYQILARMQTLVMVKTEKFRTCLVCLRL